MGIRHHELCFGCGQQNLFGLQMELDEREDGSVAGRFFVKQDHQGPPGVAHGGIVGTALDEAMALVVHAAGIPALTARFEVDLHRPAPVGAFVGVTARIDERAEGRLQVSADATAEDGEVLARARGTFVEIESRPSCS